MLKFKKPMIARFNQGLACLPILMKPKRLQYILSLKKEIIFALIIFVLSSMVGFFTTRIYIGEAGNILESLRKLADLATGFDDWELFILIFLNNSLKIVFSALAGIFFSIVPLFFLITNGFLVGMVAELVGKASNFSSFWVGILPHGILEIPALIIGSAIGFRLGNTLLKKVGGRKAALKDELAKAIDFCFKILVPNQIPPPEAVV